MCGKQKLKVLPKRCLSVLLLILLQVSSEHVDTMYQRLETKESFSNECTLNASVAIIRCNYQNGDNVTIRNSYTMPGKSKCMFRYNERISFVYCDDTGRTHYTNISDTLLNRERRQVGDITIAGAAIGSVFGPVGTAIGAAVGLVGDIVAFFCIFFCPSKDPNHRPTITCPLINNGANIIAEKGKTTAVVSWSKPKAEDKDHDKIRVTHAPAYYVIGKEYSEGSHNVYFTVKDKYTSSQCEMDFTIEVKRCEHIQSPHNGAKKCNGLLYGNSCSFTCDNGYIFASMNKGPVVCKINSLWSGNTPKCKAKLCDQKPLLKDGQLHCRTEPPTYGVRCDIGCKDGYEVNGPNVVQCDENSKWGQMPVCEDVEPPSFGGSCPKDIQIDIDNRNNTAVVNWDLPTGTDNSGEDPNIFEIHGFAPGQIFVAGTHMVQYAILDNSTNQGERCTFSIQVKTISCEPPNLNFSGGEYMKYNCPDLHRLGAECFLSCRSGYPLGGENKIQCLNDVGSNPPVLRWRWDENGLEPFCREIDCPDLQPPVNGALSCSLWDHGHMCQIQCQQGFDVPFIRDGLYVCGKSTGKWRPDSNVPDCNPKKNSHQMHLPSTLYYYTGQCNSSAENLLQIKENFVMALNSSKFMEVCVGVPECQARFVNVTCGPVVTRSRRDTFFVNRNRRSDTELAYSVKFDLILPYEAVSNKTQGQVFADNENMLYDMINAVQNEVVSGHFDINMDDLQIRNDSLDPGRPDLKCPKGTMVKRDTASCVGCSPGRFYSEDTSACEYCPVGTYQDEPDSVKCNPCPSNSNTTDIGTVNMTECLAYCSAGSFSPTGLSPCEACPSNAYQPDVQTNFCIPCGRGKRASIDGSKSEINCKVYDVQLSFGNPARIVTDIGLSTLTLSTWLYFRETFTDNQTILQMESQDDNYYQRIHQNGNITVDINGSVFYSKSHIETSKWSHFVTTISPRAFSVYLDGAIILNETDVDIQTLTEGSYMELNGDIQFSTFYVLNRSSSEDEIVIWASSCNASINGAHLSMDDLAKSQNSKITVPSMCDSFNDCASSPCGEHVCEDGVDSYICHCKRRYTGRQCEIPPDFCLHNACENGATCVSRNTKYICSCPYGYSGAYCGTKAVDGQWSDWSRFTSCSKSCGGGIQSRTRQCDSPPPDPEGSHCEGNSSASQECNSDDCPECIRLKSMYGVTIHCNETAIVKRCTISCRPGLVFSKPPLPYYECGFSTGYEWNHQNENNPSATLPTCSKVDPPKQLSVSFDGNYVGVSCTRSNRQIVFAAINSNLPSLSCTRLGICTGNVTRNTCVSKSISVTVELRSIMGDNDSGFDLEDLATNKSGPSPELKQFVNQSVELERSAQQLFNGSEDFFKVNIDGLPHTVAAGPGGLSFTAKVHCDEGSVRSGVFCAVCPAGSYSDGEKIVFCPLGQYQDETGQTKCKPCPSGQTTTGVGSVHITECKLVTNNDTVAVTELIDEKYNAGKSIALQVALGASGSVLFLVIAISVTVVIVKYNRKRRSEKVTGKQTDLRMDTFDKVIM